MSYYEVNHRKEKRNSRTGLAEVFSFSNQLLRIDANDFSNGSRCSCVFSCVRITIHSIFCSEILYRRLQSVIDFTRPHYMLLVNQVQLEIIQTFFYIEVQKNVCFISENMSRWLFYFSLRNFFFSVKQTNRGRTIKQAR